MTTSTEPDTPRNTTAAPASHWFIALATVAATAQVARFIATNPLGRPSLFVDDAYYYFGIARNIVRGNGSTWDGISSTNGYHPLWMIVLLPIFGIVRGRSNVLVPVKILAGLLWIFALRLVASIARAVGAPRAMWAGALPMVVYSIFFARSTPFAGVETGLLLPILLMMILVMLQPEQANTLAKLGGLGAAATLTRLDAIATVFMLSMYVGYRTPGALALRDRAGRVMRVASPSVAAMAGVAVVNRLWTGEFLTVSSRAKALGGGTSSHYAVRQYFSQPGSLPIVVGIGAVTLVVSLLTLLATNTGRGKSTTNSTAQHLAQLLAMMWCAEFASTLVFDSQSSWPQWPWYFYNSFIILLLAPGLLLQRWWPKAWSVDLSRARPKPSHRATALAMSLAVAIGASVGWVTAPHANGNENFYTQGAKAAAALNIELPADAVIAMGDRAGAFGYFVNRPVVQLEGIVNSHEFLDAVEHGTINRFLRRASVTYYAKSAHVEDRYRLETDGGPEATAQKCGWRFEPFFGESDKMRFTICTADIVYTATSENGEQLTVWRLTQPVTMFAMPKN